MKNRSVTVNPATLGARRTPPRANSRRRSRQTNTPAIRRTNLVLTAWAVTAVSLFLGLAPEEGWQLQPIGVGLTTAMIAGNLLIGQTSPATVVRPWFSAVVAVAYSLLLLGSWQIGDQEAVQIFVGAIAVFDLAVVGLSLGEITAVALAMTGIYLITV